MSWTVWAGTGGFPEADGPRLSAKFQEPYQIACDPVSGIVMVADFSTGHLRRIDVAGNVTTITPPAGFWLSVTLGADNLFYACRDASGQLVDQLDSAGTILATRTFALPIDLTAATADLSGNWYATADIDQCVLIHNGVSDSIFAGAPTGGSPLCTQGFVDGASNVAEFNTPTDIDIDIDNGVLYVCDQNNFAIRTVNLGTGTVATPVGDISTQPASPPYTGTWSDGTGNAATFGLPQGIGFDPATGILYIAESSPINIVRKAVVSGWVVTHLAVPVNDATDVIVLAGLPLAVAHSDRQIDIFAAGGWLLGLKWG